MAAEGTGAVALAPPAQGEIVTKTTTKTIRGRNVTGMMVETKATVMIGGEIGMMMVRIGGGGAAGVQKGAGEAGAGAASEEMTETKTLMK